MQTVMERIDGVEAWMVQYMADLLDIPGPSVDVLKTFDRFGLDSTATVSFTSDLGRWLGVKLDTAIMIENDTIKAVAQFIRAQHGATARA